MQKDLKLTMITETKRKTRRALLLLIGATFIAIIVLAAALLGGRGSSAAAGSVDDQILASTVQIEVYDNGGIKAGAKQTYVALGLGTLLEYDGERYILTHNHWPNSLVDVKRVELHSASGEPLVTLDRAAFLTLVRYRDAGTLLLAAPQLPGVSAAQLGDRNSLASGDKLRLAVRDARNGSAITVIQARVERVGGKGNPGQLRLHGPKTAVAPGDSGGGVWHEGQLVGNLWGIIETVQKSPRPGSSGSSAAMRPSGSYLAALHPLPTAIKMPQGSFTYERGLKE